MSLSEELYKEIILEHSREPSRRGQLDNPTAVQEGVNRSCGDEVEVQVLIDQDSVKDIRVNCQGCSICTASGSLMAEAMIGRSINDAHSLIANFKGMVKGEEIHFDDDLEDLEALKGVQKYPIRVKCATLCWNTLEQTLQDIST